MRLRPPRWLTMGLLFAVLAAASAFQPLARQSYIAILMGRESPQAQASGQALPEEFPVPRGLDWSPRTSALIERVGTVTGAVALAWQLAVWGLMLHALLRLLNPTFFLTTTVESAHPFIARIYMHTPPLIKAFLIATTAFIPMAVAWWILGSLLGDGPWSVGVRLALVGAVAWVLFSSESVAGDYEAGGFELPRERRTLRSLVARGAVFGAAAGAAAAFWPVVTTEWLLGFYQALGAFTEGNWWRMTGIVTGLAAGLGFGAGGLAAALAPAGIPARRRALAALAPAFVLALTLWLGRAGIPGRMASRYDYPVAGSPVEMLARAAGVRRASSGAEDVVVFTPMGSRSLRVELQSVTELDAGPEAAARLDAFVRRRRHVTALAGPAYVTLRDAAGLAWDPAAGLRVDVTRLTACPEPRFMPDFVRTLSVAAAEPATLKAVDALADPRRFRADTVEARTLLGDLYAGLGERARAERWYRAAEVPRTQLPERLAARLRYVDGTVTGRLMRGGMPLTGARVGLAPAHALRDIARSRAADGRLLPFWFRWLTAAARTDASGRFALRRLPAGSYRLLVSHPSVTGTPAGGPGEVYVGMDRPTHALGDIDVAL